MKFRRGRTRRLGRATSKGSHFALATLVLSCSILLPAQQKIADTLPDSPVPQASASAPDPKLYGSISGVVMDPTGAAIAGAAVRLTWNNLPPNPTQAQEARIGSNGQFTFTGIPAGTFQLSITASGFAPATITGTLSAGQVYTVPPITLPLASSDTEIDVHLTQVEIAQVQIDAEEKQRVLGVVPNFYVSYDPNAVPLSPKQKFTLAGHFMLDPINFALTGFTAGLQQASDTDPSWGQGASGYAKRYAAATGTFFSASLLENAALPIVFKQDPRYFYKGTGTIRSRVFYAIAMSVVAKGDNGRWQPNYSGIIGGLAAAGISNVYYPARDRDGVGLTFANAGIGTAENAAGNILQEFLIRKLTPHNKKKPPTP
jgi:Carboxypeptidase regulatory-like domain